MIHVDESDPVGEIESSFPLRDVTVKRGTDAKEFYDLLTEIGRGKFGTVYKCRQKSTGRQFAAKFVPIPKRDDRRNVEREVEIMNSLQHSLIIQLYDAFEYQKMMCVVLELIEGGELFDRVIDDDFVLTEKACVVFIRQVCQAMEFVHRNSIIHLDLKPENILCLTREGNRIKIIDFGLARKYDPDKKLQVLFGTPEFVAPEVVNFDRISFGTDMWSVGVICYVLLSGLSPFMGATDIDTMANVTIGKFDFDDEAFSTISEDALSFIRKLLVKDISERMTASECIEHIWLKRRPIDHVATKQATKLSSDILNNVYPLPTEELGTTKENLKNFIERWEEHPNSPYIFDLDRQYISPVMANYDDMKVSNSPSSSRDLGVLEHQSMAATNQTINHIKQSSERCPVVQLTSIVESDNESIIKSNENGCSPSPCESLSSTSDIQHLNGTDDPIRSVSTNNLMSINALNDTPKLRPKSELFEDLDLNKPIRDYLQSFERRHSDSNCVINKSSSCEKINLADEIKKLSDRLLMLSSINSDLNNLNEKMASVSKTDEKKKKAKENGTKIKMIKTVTTERPDYLSYLKPIKKKSSISDKFNRSISVSEKLLTNSVSGSSTLTKTNTTTKDTKLSTGTTKKTTQHSTLVDERLKLLDETPILSRKLNGSRLDQMKQKNGIIAKSPTNIKTTFTKPSTETVTDINNRQSTGSPSRGGNVPWTVQNKRAKFRITQKSRDVPIGCPDTHQTVFLDESASTTKDCLLHLLNKYNAAEARQQFGNSGRHQSISFGYGIADSLENRSMSSLNAFFQRHANVGTTVRQIQAHIESKSGGSGKP